MSVQQGYVRLQRLAGHYRLPGERTLNGTSSFGMQRQQVSAQPGAGGQKGQAFRARAEPA